MDKYKAQLKLVEYDLQMSAKPGTHIEMKLARLTDSIVGILRVLEQLTIVPTTAPALMPDYRWDVERATTPTTRPSSPSGPPVTESGPAAHGSECAHKAMRIEPGLAWVGPKKWAQCLACNVWMWFGVTPVPAVDPTTSTSAKQGLKESVENSTEGSVQSPSSELIKHQKWCAWYDHDSRGCTCGALIQWK